MKEIKGYIKILEKLSNDLTLLQGYINGNIKSEETIQMYNEIANLRVPKEWQNLCYETNKPLLSWFEELCKKVEYIRNWMNKSEPKSFWLPAFINPNALLTAIIIQNAKRSQIPLEKAIPQFTILKCNEDEIKDFPKEGTIIYGLYLNNGKWNSQNEIIEPSNKSPTQLPPILITVISEPKEDQFIYKCPIFRNLDSSEPLKLCIELPHKKTAQYWDMIGLRVVLELNE